MEAMEIIAEARRTADAAAQEIKELKKQITEKSDTTGINQRQSELRRGLNDAQNRIQASQPERVRPKESRDIIIGDTVELVRLGTKASVIAINKDGVYELQAGILKLTAKRDEIYLLENESAYSEKKMRPAHSGRTMHASTVGSEIDLRGMDTIESVCVMERYIDEAMRSNLQSVRIIHGKGTGAVRAAVHQALKKNKQVKNFRLGRYGEGEDGVTIAELR
jgi:DNA mismatch repair protein MutS2